MAVIHSVLVFFLTASFFYEPITAEFSSEISDAISKADIMLYDAADTNFREVMKCPRNEHFSHCGARCQRNCTNVNENPEICVTVCIDGCICKRGLVRALNGQCIKHQDCSKVKDNCPAGEHFDQCSYHCQRNCSNWNQSFFTCPMVCEPGCVCDEGTVRESIPSGRCIKPEKCRIGKLDTSELVEEKKCPPHSHYTDCMGLCPPTCPNFNENPTLCEEELKCIPGCLCDPGYVKGPNGRCIKPEDCPKDSVEEKKCPSHSHYTDCMGLCPRTCWNLNENPTLCEEVECIPGCLCDRGYVKGPNGRCIRPEECPQNTGRCPAGQHYDVCSYHCQERCSSLNETLLCNSTCVPGCVCDEGTIRESTPDSKCIKPEECQAKIQPNLAAEDFCPQNEEFSKCEAHCERNCKNWKEKNVPCIRLCVPGCVCKPGFVRSPRGRCIETRRCPSKFIPGPFPKVCPRNEVWSRDSAHCVKDCKTFTNTLPCLPISIPGCICQTGWVRGTDGKCIMPKDCPKKAEEMKKDAFFPIPTLPSIICERNEIISLCHKSCPDDCTNYQDKHRRCPVICKPSCVCLSGYVRGPDGKCIKPEQCPKEKKPEDCTTLEYYSTCGTACENNCTNYNIKEKACNKRCTIGCFCLPGYVRGPTGDCIWPFDCVTSGKAFEELSESEGQALSTSNNFEDAKESLTHESEWVEEPMAWTVAEVPELDENERDVTSKSDEDDYASQTLNNEIEWKSDGEIDRRHGCPDLDACQVYCYTHFRKRAANCVGWEGLVCRCF